MSRSRRRYQQEVAQLLGRIETARRERLRLQAGGVRKGIVDDLDRKLERARLRLAMLVSSPQATRLPGGDGLTSGRDRLEEAAA